MWQVLLAAAVAGSTSLVAKHFLSPANTEHPQKDLEKPQDSSFESPLVTKECKFGSDNEGNSDQRHESGGGNHKDGTLFRFLSSGSSGRRKKDKKVGSFGEKSGSLGRRLKYKDDGDKNETRSGGEKRFSVCLKKRRISVKTVSGGKSASCPPSTAKDSSLFGWGVGIGIMCMMSAGKAEISKLSTAMDETSKVVEELRDELHKRKLKRVAASSKNISNKHLNVLRNESTMEDMELEENKVSVVAVIDDAECPSSVLTEEPEPRMADMDQLEAELEGELQKLPWTADATGSRFGKDDSLDEFVEQEGQGAIGFQSHAILPSELDKKLCHLLIEQQENHIDQLETELHVSQSKLQEKEAELQALKDCVRRLTQFSLSNASDDEAEVKMEQECTREWEDNFIAGESESRKSVVGMKRPIEY